MKVITWFKSEGVKEQELMQIRFNSYLKLDAEFFYCKVDGIDKAKQNFYWQVFKN